MSKIEDELITKECYAMQKIILENFTREAKWLYFQMDIVKYLKDKGINLVCDYEQKIKELQSQLDQANESLKDAIVPKFKIGQEVFIVNTDYYYKKDYKVEKHKIVGIEDKVDRKNTYVRWYSLEFKDCSASYSKRYKFLEKNVFTTEAEAEKKLQELRGGE